MDYPKFIISNQKEEYISIQRVKQTWYLIRRNNTAGLIIYGLQ